MGIPAGLLIAVHILGSSVAFAIAWLWWALTETEGGDAPNGAYVFLLALVLFFLALGLWLALLWGRRTLALALVGGELAVGVALWAVSGASWDRGLWILALAIGVTGIGAVGAAAASPAPRAPV